MVFAALRGGCGLYAAHHGLMAAWQDNTAPAPPEKRAAAARLEDAYAAWDDALAVIDEARKKQAQAPGLAEPVKKALAHLSPRPAAARHGSARCVDPRYAEVSSASFADRGPDVWERALRRDGRVN